MNNIDYHQIEARRKMFHWFIDGWGYHITPDNKFSMFPKHGISWDMYHLLTPEFVTQNYNININETININALQHLTKPTSN